MKHVLVKTHRGIIDDAIFFDNPVEGIKALESFVKAINPEHDDACLYDKMGFVANAKSFLDDHDRYQENSDLVDDILNGGNGR